MSEHACYLCRNPGGEPYYHSRRSLARTHQVSCHRLDQSPMFFARLGQFDKQVSCLERSRAAVHQYGTPYEIATHSHLYASTRTDPEEARSLYEQALAILREIGATWEVAFVIDRMGRFAFALGQTLEARRLHEEALALWRASGEHVGTSDALMELGQVAYTLGNYDEGRRLLQESLAIEQAVGSKTGRADCQELLGEIAYAQGQFAEAEARFWQQLAILREQVIQITRLGVDSHDRGAEVPTLVQHHRFVSGLEG